MFANVRENNTCIEHLKNSHSGFPLMRIIFTNLQFFGAFHSGLPYYLNVYTKESQWESPTSPAKPDGDASKDAGQVQCAHLLVKHKHSRRPSSWREEKITRTKDEARAILNDYHQKVSFSIIFQ